MQSTQAQIKFFGNRKNDAIYTSVSLFKRLLTLNIIKTLY